MQRYILTGGPGSGKTTLLQFLQAEGYACVSEVARRVIRERCSLGLSPRPEAAEFAQAILRCDIEEYEKFKAFPGVVFFDRGIGDALCMIFNCGALGLPKIKEIWRTYPYSAPVFLLPPWKAIFVNDTERDQTFEEAVHISERLAAWYVSLGSSVVEVPLGSPSERAAFILRAAGVLCPHDGS